MREGRKGEREAGGRESDRRGHFHERHGGKAANFLKAPTDHSHAVQELKGRAGSGLAQLHTQPQCALWVCGPRSVWFCF